MHHMSIGYKRLDMKWNPEDWEVRHVDGAGLRPPAEKCKESELGLVQVITTCVDNSWSLNFSGLASFA